MLSDFLRILQSEMKEPTAFGWYHILWLSFIVIGLIAIYKTKNQRGEQQLKLVLGLYSIITLVTEILKQISWSFEFNELTASFEFDYLWYSFPFQLCTTPMYVCLICFLMKECKLRDYLLSYVAYITILGSISVIFIPDNCFVESIVANIHTMCLHYGSFLVSMYLLMSGTVKIHLKEFLKGLSVFFGFVTIANIMNLFMYNSGITEGETFNMFYISPYFISELPVFNVIQQNVPYILFLLTYLVALSLGGFIIYEIANASHKIFFKLQKKQ